MKLNIFYFHSHSHSHLKKNKRLIISLIIIIIIILIIIVLIIIIVVLIIIILLYKNGISKNLLDISSDNRDLPRFVTKKWIEVYDQSEENYNPNKEIRIKTPMLRSDLYDFSDAYIVIKGNITVDKKTFTADDFEDPNNTAANATATKNANNNAFGEKKLVFKNNAPFVNCITKINDINTDNAEDLDVVMPMYNLLEYSKYYKKQREVCGITIEMNQIVVQIMII